MHHIPTTVIKCSRPSLVRLAVWAGEIGITICASLVCPLRTLLALDPFLTGHAVSERFAAYQAWPFLVFTAGMIVCRFALLTSHRCGFGFRKKFRSFLPSGC